MAETFETPPPPGSAAATRQGHRDRPVLWVLVVSLALALAGLATLWLVLG
jgi:hypothetical protein